eukprot:jgi/Psemu1/304615/fgenesh1_kg.163_\
MDLSALFRYQLRPYLRTRTNIDDAFPALGRSILSRRFSFHATNRLVPYNEIPPPLSRGFSCSSFCNLFNSLCRLTISEWFLFGMQCDAHSDVPPWFRRSVVSKVRENPSQIREVRNLDYMSSIDGYLYGYNVHSSVRINSSKLV